MGSKRSFHCQGFILLEAILSLGILAILLPSAYQFLQNQIFQYHELQLEEEAGLLAQIELAKIESEVLIGQAPLEKHFDCPSRSVENIHFNFSCKVSVEGPALRKIQVQIYWQARRGLAGDSLEEFFYAPSQNKK